ncbi:C1 family peptidase [Mycoplasma phocimorsus]|uniref:C1 family peptidase n=1 Tax=Mycoplasma phocimorsus TaxID=3045839 RepID=UPI0024BF2494|nr:C1 family peptidase [Mycoplasma phocimorsus]MDJ1646523.1 C1 family peptidase [Mycoplasma phocimorsus]
MNKKIFLTGLSLTSALFLPSAQLTQYKETKFDPRDKNTLTDIRNQFAEGICWAFSTIGVVEANLIKKQFITIPQQLDLSEQNLAFKTLNRWKDADPLHNTDFDNYRHFDWKTSGFEPALAAVSLFQWNKLKNENLIGSEFSEYVVKNYIEIDHKKSNYREEVKKAIEEYGAVSFLFLVYPGHNGKYYNSKEYIHQKQRAHAATIVGWDDNIDKSLFGSNTKQNGAWLVKNSWGNSFGENGYYWVSYDTNVSELFTLDMMPRSSYQNNYYYDGSFRDVHGHQYKKAAVAYKAKGASINQEEKLKAVNVGFDGENVKLEISVYKQKENNINPRNLELGEKITSKIVEFEKAGIRTIELDKEVTLKAGEWFSIVAEIKSGSENAKLRFGEEKDWQNDFSYIQENNQWISSQKAKNGAVARIKAFTKNHNIETNLHDLRYAKVTLKNYDYRIGDNFNLDDIEVSFNGRFLIREKDYTLELKEFLDPDQGFYYDDSVIGYNHVVIKAKGTYQGKNETFLTVRRGKEHKYNLENKLEVGKNINSTSEIPLNAGWKIIESFKLLKEGDNFIKIYYSGNNGKYYKNNSTTLNVFKNSQITTEKSIKDNELYLQHYVNNTIVQNEQNTVKKTHENSNQTVIDSKLVNKEILIPIIGVIATLGGMLISFFTSWKNK